MRMRCKSKAHELLRDTRGLTTVEYIIVLCLIALVGIALWRAFGQSVNEKVQAGTEAVEGLETGAQQ